MATSSCLPLPGATANKDVFSRSDKCAGPVSLLESKRVPIIDGLNLASSFHRDDGEGVTTLLETCWGVSTRIPTLLEVLLHHLLHYPCPVPREQKGRGLQGSARQALVVGTGGKRGGESGTTRPHPISSSVPACIHRPQAPAQPIPHRTDQASAERGQAQSRTCPADIILSRKRSTACSREVEITIKYCQLPSVLQPCRHRGGSCLLIAWRTMSPEKAVSIRKYTMRGSQAEEGAEAG